MNLSTSRFSTEGLMEKVEPSVRVVDLDLGRSLKVGRWQTSSCSNFRSIGPIGLSCRAPSGSAAAPRLLSTVLLEPSATNAPLSFETEAE